MPLLPGLLTTVPPRPRLAPALALLLMLPLLCRLPLDAVDPPEWALVVAPLSREGSGALRTSVEGRVLLSSCVRSDPLLRYRLLLNALAARPEYIWPSGSGGKASEELLSWLCCSASNWPGVTRCRQGSSSQQSQTWVVSSRPTAKSRPAAGGDTLCGMLHFLEPLLVK